MKKQTRTHVFFVVLSFFILTASAWLTSCSSIKKRSWNEAEIVNAKYKGFAGAVVVCRGAGSPQVRLQVVESVSAFTGLGTDRIVVQNLIS